jgi:RHS repeat-associated protein
MNVVAGFGYDASGNVLSKTDVPVYDVNNRLTRCGAIEYEWNALGQLTRKRPSNGRSKTETLFEWGTNGLLNAVDLPVGNSGTRRRVEFTYDNFARRTKKQSTERDVNGVVLRVHAVRFVWDGAYLVHELRYELVDGELKPCGQRAFFYDDETGQPLAHREAASHSGAAEQDWAFYLNDQVGTPDRLINSRGEVVEAFAHDVWGFAQSAGTMTPLRFRGQYYDDETGLCFNRFRYYDPEVGRYISPDPLGIYAGVNSYRYADNQPTGVVDPMGLMAVTTIKKKSRTRRSGVSDEYEGQSSGDGSLRDGDDPAVTEAVRNAERHTGGGGQCGEIDALHQMAADIREQRRRDGKAHSDPKEENAAIRKDLAELVRSDFEVETKFKPGGKNMNPCKHCAQIFRELGLHPAQEKGRHIVGADGKSWKGHPVHGGGSPSTQPSSTPPFVGS